MVDVEVIKHRLRISHCKMDLLLTADIYEAKADMIRCGVSPEMVEAPNEPLIDAAIVAYGMFKETNDERFQEQYRSRVDELRKSAGYKED